MISNNKILVTGGAGFIGSHLVELLLEQGVDEKNIRILALPREKLSNLPKKSFDILRGDIRDKKTVSKALRNVDLIFHLAARTMDGSTRYNDYFDVNTQGTQNILDICKGKKIKKLVFFSSIAVFGLPAWVGEIKNWNENQAKNPKEEYGRSKLEAEKRVMDAHKKYGLPYIIIRPTSVYGPRDKRNLLELYKVIKKHLFVKIGNGKNLMDYIFVRDLAKGAIQAAKSNKTSGDYILGAGKPLTQDQITKAVGKSIDTKIPNFYIPKLIATILSYALSFTFKLVDKKSPLFPERVRVMTTNCYFDIKKARKELKFNPATSFEEGTKITGRWLIETGTI